MIWSVNALVFYHHLYTLNREAPSDRFKRRLYSPYSEGVDILLIYFGYIKQIQTCGR